MGKYFTLTYQNLVITYQDKKTLGNKMRDLLEKNVTSCTLTPRGIEYYTFCRITQAFGGTGATAHTDPYPDGVTAKQIDPLIYDQSVRLDVDVEKMHNFLGSDPKPVKPKPKTHHRTWMTPEQYERQKALNPTLGTILS